MLDGSRLPDLPSPDSDEPSTFVAGPKVPREVSGLRVSGLKTFRAWCIPVPAQHRVSGLRVLRV